MGRGARASYHQFDPSPSFRLCITSTCRMKRPGPSRWQVLRLQAQQVLLSPRCIIFLIWHGRKEAPLSSDKIKALTADRGTEQHYSLRKFQLLDCTSPLARSIFLLLDQFGQRSHYTLYVLNTQSIQYHYAIDQQMTRCRHVRFNPRYDGTRSKQVETRRR